MSTPNISYSLADLAAVLSCPVPDSGGDRVVVGLATLEDACEGDLAMLGGEAYLGQFARTRAAGVIVARKIALPKPCHVPVLIVDDADLAMAKVLQLYAKPISRPQGIDGGARVADDAVIGDGVAIGFGAHVGRRCQVGAGTIIHANVHLADDVTVGAGCEFFPGVVIADRISIGQRVTIFSNAVIGADGFGYRWDGTRHVKIPQIGTVIIEDDVEIGACSCIDRAKVGATRIGRGSKIDNLVQVGHNVSTGPHCIIAGQAGIAGSAKLGAGVVLGGQVAVRDHIVINDGAMAAACAGIAEDVPAKSIVSGIPAQPHRQTLREQGAMRHLPEMRQELRKLRDELESMKKNLASPVPAQQDQQ
jgi:UDP-3-O-[3-hydroxymyristoyl] glucosamine N-acyltransferase